MKPVEICRQSLISVIIFTCSRAMTSTLLFFFVRAVPFRDSVLYWTVSDATLSRQELLCRVTIVLHDASCRRKGRRSRLEVASPFLLLGDVRQFLRWTDDWTFSPACRSLRGEFDFHWTVQWVWFPERDHSLVVWRANAARKYCFSSVATNRSDLFCCPAWTNVSCDVIYHWGEGILAFDDRGWRTTMRTMKSSMTMRRIGDFRQDCRSPTVRRTPTTLLLAVVRIWMNEFNWSYAGHKDEKRSQENDDDSLPARPINSSSSVWTVSVVLSLFSFSPRYVEQTLMENVYLAQRARTQNESKEEGSRHIYIDRENEWMARRSCHNRHT